MLSKILITTGLCLFSLFSFSQNSSNRVALSEAPEFSFNEASINIELYPNPFTNLVYIKSAHEVKKVKVMDDKGKTVFESEGGNELDLEHLIKGTYVLDITFDKARIQRVINKS